MDSSDGAIEDDSTSEAQLLWRPPSSPPLLPLPASLPALSVDVWVLLSAFLTVADVCHCAAVCRSWRGTLSQDKLWRALSLRYGLPPARGTVVSFREHFVTHSAAVVGPTVPLRKSKPIVETTSFPPAVVAAVEALFKSGRRLSLTLAGDFLLLNDDLGIVSVQLVEPFRLASVNFETRGNGTPVPMRRSWTDGVHVVVQTPFVSKSIAMDVAVYSLTIKPNGSGLSLTMLGIADRSHLAEFPYLMACFFGKTFFLLEFHDSDLFRCKCVRISLSCLEKSSASVVLSGGGLSGGQPAEQLSMPASAYSNWKYVVLRKFPDAPIDTDREHLFVYDQHLQLLHDYTAPTGERWRYPFIRKCWNDLILLEAHSYDGVWIRTYKIGGPVLLPVWKKKEDGIHLTRHVPGAVLDTSGCAMATVSAAKRGRFQLQLQYFPVGFEPKPQFVIDSWDSEVDRKCIRVLFGPNGLVLYFLSAMDLPVTIRPKLLLLRFRAGPRQKKSSLLKKSVMGETGSEALQRELITLTNDLSVDELMALVQVAREKAKKKPA